MRVQRDKEFNELLEGHGRKILGLLGAGNPARDVAKAVPCAKSNVTYWKNKLLKVGAIKAQSNDVVKTYSLTSLGSNLLTGSEVRVPVLLEDHAVKFAVVEHEKCRLDWVKLGEPRNWVKLGLPRKIEGARVVKNADRSIIIHPGHLRGFDVDELLVQSGRVVERVKQILEGRFGMLLSTEGAALHKPIFRFYTDEARELAKVGTTTVDGVGCIDKSPPEREPHEEYYDRRLAKAKQTLLEPVRLLNLESKFDDLASEVHGWAEKDEKLLTQLAKILSDLYGAEPDAAAGSRDVRGKNLSYVA